ncbi:hypothetical protein MWH25_01270 [Natroniella acetigena]|uniref:hypothetical protein n=1 Tax=Natroniella acetigena TaxID=52004 RepID=UPI00200AB0B5|nr:hypothetical protein [Natroniella acetigena]MCK8826377.1 hypothetical protein [Natroniella acetigena]
MAITASYLEAADKRICIVGPTLDYEYCDLNECKKPISSNISAIELANRFHSLDEIDVLQVIGGKRYYYDQSRVEELLSLAFQGQVEKVVQMDSGSYQVYMMLIKILDQELIWQVQGWSE